MAVSSNKVGPELLKALRLEGKQVRSLTIRFVALEAVVVTAEILVTDKEAGDVATLLKRYKLVDTEADQVVEITGLSSSSKEFVKAS